ncbi:hypothetical protein DRN74_05400 [Candidatus Micrarchaeota archaeon]|nr:MAG: hypothetical protein DRN74_05400 [Candidatus Micrarchaeota archaeon]
MIADRISILIVDDEVGMRETLSDILEDMGYHVAIAADGYEAVEKVKDNYFDVILMDVKMPGMDGVDTFREIKRISPETAVVMMTAYAVDDRLRDAMSEGAYGVFYKPLEMQKVVELVEGVRVGGHILVVDKDPKVHDIFKGVLEPRGYKVSSARTSEEAIRVARENKHDMIFIEMELPLRDGLDTYMAIKEINPEAVAVMMTAHPRAANDFVIEALMEDAYTCLYKPLAVEEVIRLVDRICRTRHQKRQV